MNNQNLNCRIDEDSIKENKCKKILEKYLEGKE